MKRIINIDKNVEIVSLDKLSIYEDKNHIVAINSIKTHAFFLLKSKHTDKYEWRYLYVGHRIERTDGKTFDTIKEAIKHNLYYGDEIYCFEYETNQELYDFLAKKLNREIDYEEA